MEIIVAVLGPMMGGLVSLFVFVNKRTQHITSEEAWHVRFGEEMAQTRDECTATRVIVDRMWMDYQNQGKL